MSLSLCLNDGVFDEATKVKLNDLQDSIEAQDGTATYETLEEFLFAEEHLLVPSGASSGCLMQRQKCPIAINLSDGRLRMNTAGTTRTGWVQCGIAATLCRCVSACTCELAYYKDCWLQRPQTVPCWVTQTVPCWVTQKWKPSESFAYPPTWILATLPLAINYRSFEAIFWFSKSSRGSLFQGIMGEILKFCTK